MILFICLAVFVTGSFFAWLLYTPWGARFAIREAARATLGSKKVSWADLEGSLAKGISVRHLEVRDIPHLPLNNFLRVQGMAVRLRALSLNGIELMVEHGRFFPHGDESIVFSLRMVDGSFVANAYTRHLDLADVRGILVEFFDVPPLKGTLKDIDLTARGRFDRPHVQGKFTIEQIDKNAFTLRDSPVEADLYFVRGRPWETHGRLKLLGGQLIGPNDVTVKLTDSLLIFSGRPQWPELNIKGVALVARTKIDISVRGTRQEPKLELSSDPPHTKEQLLMMLATGKAWSGLDAAVATNQMTPEMAADFIEYLFFGGSGNKFAEMLGLSDISFVADSTVQGVRVSKGLSERLDVGYGVRRQTSVARSATLTQTLDGEFRMTDKVTFGVQKEFKPRAPAAAGTSALDPADIPDDRVYMRYKTRF